MDKLPEPGSGVKLMIFLLKVVFFIYDKLTYIFWFILNNPRLTMKNSNRIKSAPIGGDLSGPWRDLKYFDSLVSSDKKGGLTIDSMFDNAVRQFGDNQLFGTREILKEEDEKQPNGKIFKKMILGKYNWQTYNAVSQRMTNLGHGMMSLGLQSRQMICFFAETRSDWMLSFQTCCRFNIAVVTLYPTLGDDAIVHGINETEVEYVLTSFDLLPKLKNVQDKIPTVTHIIYMESPTGKLLREEDKIPGVSVLSLAEVEKLGAINNNNIFRVHKPTEYDRAVIMYTSGSTGVPKGVILSHANIVAGCTGLLIRLLDERKDGTADTYIGYLPLAHVLELTAEFSCICGGVKIGYSTALTLVDGGKLKRGCRSDLRELRPTVMAAVPAIMDRLYKGVYEIVSKQGPGARALFEVIYEHKMKKYLNGYDTPFFNRTIFKIFRRIIGGKVRLLMCGGAPLSMETQRCMNVLFCCPVGQGYGLTETCGSATVQEASDLSTGRVGHPLCSNQIKLINWEEGNYTVNDTPNPRGEVLVGGNNVALGYYKMPEKTAEDFVVIAGVKYFKTGDIGEMCSDGCLKIIDRKKDLVKLQAGEYVSLGKVESALLLSPYVDFVCVYAESSKSYAIALIVPAKKKILEIAKDTGFSSTNMEDLCINDTIIKIYNDLISKHSKQGGLEKFEIPQKIILCPEIWTPTSGFLTDAMKLKRKNIHSHFEKEITAIYI